MEAIAPELWRREGRQGFGRWVADREAGRISKRKSYLDTFEHQLAAIDPESTQFRGSEWRDVEEDRQEGRAGREQAADLRAQAAEHKSEGARLAAIMRGKHRGSGQALKSARETAGHYGHAVDYHQEKSGGRLVCPRCGARGDLLVGPPTVLRGGLKFSRQCTGRLLDAAPF